MSISLFSFYNFKAYISNLYYLKNYLLYYCLKAIFKIKKLIKINFLKAKI